MRHGGFDKGDIKGRLRDFLQSENALYFGTAILAVIVFCLIYGVRILNPRYTDWLMAGEDLTQHYLGWKAYRNSPWMFPPGMLDTLAYPDRTSVIFTDSLPLFAVFFKLLSPILPADFQYFGLWGGLCFVLQAVLTVKIVRKYSDDKIFAVLSGVLMAFTPAMIWRMYLHTALAGQWLILYGLEPLFNHEKYTASPKKLFRHVCMMGILASAIHIYFVFICGIILVGICLYWVFTKKKLSQIIISLGIYLASAAAIVALLGGFSSGMEAGTGGLGEFSANLNALFNPQGWSCIFQTLPLYGGGQYEGFAYLGAGCLLALFTALIFLAGHSEMKGILKESWKKAAALSAMAFCAAVAALSPVVTWNDKCLKTFEIPEFINDLWSVFRASGRIVWIVVYVAVLCSLALVAKLSQKRMAVIVLTVCLVLQVYDIHIILAGKHEQFDRVVTYDSGLKNTEFWDGIAGNEGKR